MMPRLKKVLKLQTLIPDLASSLVQFKVIPNHPTEPILPSESDDLTQVNLVWIKSNLDKKQQAFSFYLPFEMMARSEVAD